jgi:transposase
MGPRFPGLALSKRDREQLEDRKRGRCSERIWRRIRMLHLLDQGWTLSDTAAALGTHRREVRRVGWRYLDDGLEAALSEDARPAPEKKLDKKAQSALIALACTDPPDGRDRWTVRLLAERAADQGIVKISRETVRRTLKDHDLKPWREKNVVRAKVGRRVHRADGRRARSAREAPQQS